MKECKGYLVVLLALFLFGCESQDRVVVMSYDCMRELPVELVGSYQLAEVVSECNGVLSSEVLTPPLVSGLLTLSAEGGLSITVSRPVEWLIQGYLDIYDGLAVVYRTPEYDDIIYVFPYHYMIDDSMVAQRDVVYDIKDRTLILEYYNLGRGCRLTFEWSQRNWFYVAD